MLKPSIFQRKDPNTQLIWTVSALLTRIKKLWLLTAQCPLKKTQWQGWMLTFLGAKCFSNIACRVEKENPFKNKMTVPDMVKTLYRDNEEERTISDPHELFTEHDKVLCFSNHNQLQNIY